MRLERLGRFAVFTVSSRLDDPEHHKLKAINVRRNSQAVAGQAPMAATLAGLNLDRIISTIRVRSDEVPPHLDNVTKLSGVGSRTS